jgi:glycosyltransferase involved in cell wall biosynthesis
VTGVTVVICAYTLARWELLRSSIESVVAQATVSVEVVIVSDHNTELFELVRSTYPALHVIENQGPAGLSGARNSGLAVATGDVVAFLDDDAAAEPGWLVELIPGYDDGDVQGVGGSIEPVWAAGRPRWFPAEFDWVVGCTYRGLPRHVAEVRNPIGANMSFRRQLFDTIGGFRDGLGRIGETPVGGEETELCIRAVQHDRDARFIYRPQAVVRHHVPAGRGTWRYFVRRCFAEGLSKAAITRSVGRAAGLASERGYATRTLPAGVKHGLTSALRGDPWGAARAAAIMLGLTVTTAGYVLGSLNRGVGQTQTAVTRSSTDGQP